MKWLLLLVLLVAPSADADEALWGRLKEGGYVLLIRHAVTEPGTGDPPGFRIGDCGTQRNLSPAGRLQARRLGEAFRARRIPVTDARTSQWCRCMDTAYLAFGKAASWRALNSTFQDNSREAEQKREVLDGAARIAPPENLVLVTHQVNIRTLVGISPEAGAIAVARSEGGELKLVGLIAAP